MDTRNLELLLNFLGVDEARCFRWDAGLLDLFTMSELESLATEVGLKAALGSRFKAARAGKKDAFIQVLLNVEGFPYDGTVPAVMRYPRQSPDGALAPSEDEEARNVADDAAGFASAEAQAAPATA